MPTLPTFFVIRDNCIVTVGFSQCGQFGAGSPRGCGADARSDGEARRAVLSLAASRTRHPAGVQPAPGASLRWTRVSHQVRGSVYTYRQCHHFPYRLKMGSVQSHGTAYT